MTYLRNTSVRIPEHLEDRFPNYGSVKCVLVRGLTLEKSGPREFKTGIGFYAIPRKGSGSKVRIGFQDVKNIGPEEDHKLVDIAKTALANEEYISRLLEECPNLQ